MKTFLSGVLVTGVAILLFVFITNFNSESNGWFKNEKYINEKFVIVKCENYYYLIRHVSDTLYTVLNQQNYLYNQYKEQDQFFNSYKEGDTIVIKSIKKNHFWTKLSTGK